MSDFLEGTSRPRLAQAGPGQNVASAFGVPKIQCKRYASRSLEAKKLTRYASRSLERFRGLEARRINCKEQRSQTPCVPEARWRIYIYIYI